MAAANRWLVVMLLTRVSEPGSAWEPVWLPRAIVPALPYRHVARLASCARTLDPPRSICLIVATRAEEGDVTSLPGRKTPQRPLLVYQVVAGRATLVAGNDRVVLHRDDGGQSELVEDGGGIAIKGRFFTLESGVACGQYWTENTTFRFVWKRRGFVRHNAIRGSSKNE